MRFISLAGAAACALALASGASAWAKPIPVDVRVEAANSRVLTSDRYLTDTTSVRTETAQDCGGSGATKSVAGATALGALVDAGRVNSRVSPVGVSDEFSFGLLVCSVGGDFAAGDSSFWLYKVDHVAPEVGADAFTVKPGDDVLWYFSDTTKNQNTGDELRLVAPTSAERGEEFVVKVGGYDAAGTSRPVEGATVRGGSETAVTDSGGIARLAVDRNATVTLRATLDPNVPSQPVKVCVNARLSKCAAPGQRIYGSDRGELIRGTKGSDLVLAQAGADRIAVRRGGRDRVRCGKGRDVVTAGRLDRVARDCEVVRRRGRV
jgi:hypothetical protein